MPQRPRLVLQRRCCCLSDRSRTSLRALENDCTHSSARLWFGMSTADRMSTSACARTPPTIILILIALATNLQSVLFVGRPPYHGVGPPPLSIPLQWRRSPIPGSAVSGIFRSGCPRDSFSHEGAAECLTGTVVVPWLLALVTGEALFPGTRLRGLVPSDVTPSADLSPSWMPLPLVARSPCRYCEGFAGVHRLCAVVCHCCLSAVLRCSEPTYAGCAGVSLG